MDSLSPVLDSLSPEENEDLSTKPDDSGDTGDKSDNIVEGKDEESDNRMMNNNTCNCPVSSDPIIVHNHPFYYCKEHPKFENIHLEVIESHLIFAQDHKKEEDVMIIEGEGDKQSTK